MDLNTIVHMALHANSSEHLERMSRPENFHEVWLGIVRNIDTIVRLVKPKHTLFLSLDGVCPRAKAHDQKRRRPTPKERKPTRQLLIEELEEHTKQEVVASEGATTGYEEVDAATATEEVGAVCREDKEEDKGEEVKRGDGKERERVEERGEEEGKKEEVK